MATVGGVSCDFAHRIMLAGAVEQIETWHPPGYDGFGAHLLGKPGSPFVFEGVLFDSESDVDAFFLAIEALVGTSITIVDDWGNSLADMFVIAAGPRSKTTALGSGYTTRGGIQIQGLVQP